MMYEMHTIKKLNVSKVYSVSMTYQYNLPYSSFSFLIQVFRTQEKPYRNT
jgi:hypothetical protein